MKKLLFFFIIFISTQQIECMHSSLTNKKPQQKKELVVKKPEAKQEIDNINICDFKDLLPKKIVDGLKKIEKWPDWAKQSTGFVLASAYFVYILFLASYL